MAKRGREEVAVVVGETPKKRAAEAEREVAEPKLEDHRKKARMDVTEDLDRSGVDEYVKMVEDDICQRCKQKNLDCYRKRRSDPHSTEGTLKDFVRCKNCVSSGRATKCTPTSEAGLSASQTSPPTRSPGFPVKRRQVFPTAIPTPPYEDCRCRGHAPSTSIPISEASACMVEPSGTTTALDAALLPLIERLDRHDRDIEKLLVTIRKLRQQKQEFLDEDEEDPLLLCSESEEDDAETED